MSETSSQPDPFEFFRRFWTPAGAQGNAQMPGFPPGMVFPTVNVEDIDKRLGELRSVEGWLALNLEMVRATIQGFEAQKATLNAYRTMNESMNQAAADVAAATRRAAGAAAGTAAETPPAGADTNPASSRRRKPG